MLEIPDQSCELETTTDCGTPPPPPSPPPVLTVTATGRPQRSYRLPKRFRDLPPEGPAPVVPAAPAVSVAPLPPPTVIQNIVRHIQETFRTGRNRFNLLREYPYRPTHDPDSTVPFEDLIDCPSSEPTSVPTRMEDIREEVDSQAPPWPFANMSIYRLMEWATTGSSRKSEQEVNRLVNDVIGAADFRAADLDGFNARRQYKQFDLSENANNNELFTGDGWRETPVHISIPTGERDPTGVGQQFTVPNLHHRSLLYVMKAALKDATARYFHFSPFKRFWQTPSGDEVRCFDEIYTSDAFLDANKKLQEETNEPGCKLEKVVLGLMFWSDSTHLANFGTAKAWPLYLYFANLSKYFRGKPTFGAAHHVAYIPSVSLCAVHVSASY
jgi:hypothetical protein